MTASRFAQIRRCGLLVLFGCLALLALLVQFQPPVAAAVTALGANAVNRVMAAGGDLAAGETRIRISSATLPPTQATRHRRPAPNADNPNIAYNPAEQHAPVSARAGFTAPAASAGALEITGREGAPSNVSRLAPAECQRLPVTGSDRTAQVEWPLFTDQQPNDVYDIGFNPGPDQRQQTRCNLTEQPGQQSGQQGQWLLPQTQTPPQAPAGQSPPNPFPIMNNDDPTINSIPLPINQWDYQIKLDQVREELLPQQKQRQAPQQEEVQPPAPENFNPPQIDQPPPAANPDCPDNDAQDYAQVEADYNDIQIQPAPGADAATADDQF